MSEGKLFQVNLLDEIPGVGTGRRVVEATIGRKWVYVRRHVADGAKRIGKQARRYRVLHSVWERLGAVPFETVPEEKGDA